jgi:hypothetical protein
MTLAMKDLVNCLYFSLKGKQCSDEFQLGVLKKINTQHKICSTGLEICVCARGVCVCVCVCDKFQADANV